MATAEGMETTDDGGILSASTADAAAVARWSARCSPRCIFSHRRGAALRNASGPTGALVDEGLMGGGLSAQEDSPWI